MVRYISNTYRKGSAVLQHNGWQSSEIQPKRGVKQGDPLSPTIFNLIIDALIKAIPGELGVEVAGRHLSALVFADYLVLFASSEKGLQEMLNTASAFLSKCGLTINTGKSQTLAWKTIPKKKMSVVDESCKFYIGNTAILTTSRTEKWKYLGVQISANGITYSNVGSELVAHLERLTRAPLKPQQCLWALRTVIIPKLMYSLVLGKTTFSMLKKFDTLIRTSLRKRA